MSIVVRKTLGRRLRALRQAAGKTPADVAEARIASTSKLSRIETGEGLVRIPDLSALCELFGVDNETRQQLRNLALACEDKGWWENYDDVLPDWFGMYVQLETEAHQLTAFDPELINGLLQTPDYHRAVLAVGNIADQGHYDRVVALRTERQRAAFEREGLLRVLSIIGEAALRRQIGGSAVLGQQIAHLIEVDERPFVDVLVIPFAAGAHPALKGGFTVLDYDSEYPPVAYVETLTGGRYVEQEDDVAVFRAMSERLLTFAQPIKEFLS